jgi:predicted dinucleotide-binding enzyme
VNIGILGAGAIGQAFAAQLARAGLGATIANSRGPASLVDTAARLGPGIVPATAAQAAASDIVFLSVGWKHIPAAVSGIEHWQNRIVIDATNPIITPGFTVADLRGWTSSERVAELLPGARLVKAFNTLRPDQLTADPSSLTGRRVIVYSGDDSDAKKQVSALIAQLGFAGIDLGTLASGGRLQQFPGGTFAGRSLLVED